MNGSAIQDYIALVGEAWRELFEIAPGDAASLDEWKIEWTLRGVTLEDREAMVEIWKGRIKV